MARKLQSSVAGAAVDAYDRHVGRYGSELGAGMVRIAGVERGHRALDVGCGTGALTEVLAAELGAGNVAAIDPSERFADACRSRVGDADIRVGVGEELPWEDGSFDAVLAQLVVDGMNDASAGVAEMRRVGRPGATLAACVWDFDGGMPLLGAVWAAAREVDEALAESHGASKTNPYSRPAELEELWRSSELERVELGRVDAGAGYSDFDDLWYPFANGVGNLGRFHDALDSADRERFKDGAAERLGSPDGPFRLIATACWVRGSVPLD